MIKNLRHINLKTKDIRIDEEYDLLYIKLKANKNKVARTMEVVPSVIIDFDKNNKVVGIEII